MHFDMLSIIKEGRKEELKSLLEEYGKVEVLSSCAQFLDKRAYVTIDITGNIKRKKGNLTLPIFAFLNDTTLLNEEIFNSSALRERQNIDKIERFSSLDIEKVKSNFIKTLFNGNLEFSKKYGKELFLRDRESFFELVANFASIGNNSMKPLMVLALDKLMIEYDENIFYLFISYMTKYRDNTDFYENSSEDFIELGEIKEKLKNNPQLLNSLEGLGLLTSLKVVEKFEINNRNRVLNKIKYEIDNTKNYIPLSATEKNLLEIFL